MKFKYILSMWFLSAGLSAREHPEILQKGFYSPQSQEVQTKLEIGEFCNSLSNKFVFLGWESSPCSNIKWRIGGYSKNGNPLIYWVIGTGSQTTLLLSGVHPDEYTPIPMGFKLVSHISNNLQAIDLTQHKVIIAPLVNPDGLMQQLPSRVNANGIDVNRNFLTSDWFSSAIESWIGGKKRSLRHFPGYFPNSESETKFQIYLIQQFLPDKILSIHAPLGFLDYDGPGDGIAIPKSQWDRQAKSFAKAISEKSNNYRVVDYSFYPGSLGNYAGNERHIPTVTLELETTDPNQVPTYWNQFLPGLIQSIIYPFERFSYTDSKKSPPN